jgi:hypothetical protein
MGQVVRKMRTFDIWQIGETESWLSDMAAQGLHLQKMGSLFTKFEKGPPKQMHYRIKITSKKEIRYNLIDFYEENGWDYAGSFQYFHVFSSPIERNASEIGNNLEEDSKTLNMLNKKYQMAILSFIIYVIIFVAFCLQTLFKGLLTYNFVLGGAFYTSIILFLYGCLSYQIFQSIKAFKKLRKHFLKGNPINHHAPWKTSMRKQNLFISFVLILWFFLTGILINELSSYEQKTLPTKELDFPIVRLMDIEQNEQMLREEHFIDGIDYLNMYISEWRPLVPTQFEIRESGIVPNVKWADKSGEYTPSLTTEIYDLRFSKLAIGLIDDLIERSIFIEDPSEYIEHQHLKFDKLIVYEPTILSKQIFAAKGKRVMVVRYYGFANLERIIEQMALKINM